MGHPDGRGPGPEYTAGRGLVLGEGAVGEEEFAGGFLEEDGVERGEEALGVGAAFDGDEEDLAGAGAPLGGKFGGGEEEVSGASGKVEPKSMEEERPSTRRTGWSRGRLR